jgi:AcrR family transcriptional regulator
MARSRKEAMAATRDALIDAGLEAFSAEGLDASLDGICARAGFTRGAFYVHFRDRDQFLVAVMDRVGQQFLETLFAGADLPTTVSRFVAAVVSGRYPLTHKGGVRPHQLLEACARSREVRQRYVALIELSLKQVAEVVRAGQRHEVRDDLAPAEVAQLLLATVIGAQTMLELEVPLEPARLAALLLKLLERPTSRRGAG